MERFVKHICGHVVKQEIKGSDSHKRDSKAAWLASKPCLKCLKNHQLTLAQDVSLPKLIGTEKQVEWALSIRARYLEFIGGQPDTKILTNLEATFWIEKRKALFKRKSA